MTNSTPIAIIGLAYRAPGVGRKDLWEYLKEAKCAWSKVPAERFDYDAFHFPDKDKAGCIAAEGGHFLPDDIYAFDAPFFHLRAEEARSVDPHHRMLLECAFEAAESAGITLLDLAGSNTGVFSAIGSPEHGYMMGEDLPASSNWTCVGGAPCMFANRLSYFFDLSGPSIAVDAACASSSYAIHMACQSLRAGECDAAFASGCALLLGPGQFSFLDTMGALSPEGKSFSYDAKASGFGRGEGGACLLLKRLDDAIESGDPIHAVILNTACNHGGRSDGITMPRRSAQESLLRQAHFEIGLDPAETPVVEGHGTGTKVGDPIEAGAFATVLASKRTSSNPLYIGSLKSNFGHTEAASGILGVIKAVMMIQHGSVLPNANFEKLNDKIEGKEKLRVAPTTIPWPSNERKRVCVTNFGFGGSNAVIILEEAPQNQRPAIHDKQLSNGQLTNGQRTNGHLINGHSVPNDVEKVNGKANGIISNGDVSIHPDRIDPGKRVYAFSARFESSLNAYLSSFRDYLNRVSDSEAFLRDLSYTLGQRRTHHPHRVAVTADSLEALKESLATAKSRKARDQNVAFVFTGQGAQHARMAANLTRYEPFNAAIEQAEDILRKLGSQFSLTEELHRPESETRINTAEISQPACTAVQLALVSLLKSWGIQPATVAGHSSGEIAAAFAAGFLSFEAAVAVAYYRGQAAVKLSQSGQKGAMLALGTSSEEASKLIEESGSGYATVAAINSPQSVTVSGDVSAIESIHQLATARSIFARRLRVEVAYHSRHMEQVAESYLESIKPFFNAMDISAGSPRPIFVSSVTGNVIEEDAVDASYWVRNLLQPVRFTDAIRGVFAARKDVASSGQRSPILIVEIGPHSALQGPIKQTVDSLRQQTDRRQDQFTYLPSLVRGTDNEDSILSLAKSLFCLGLPVQLGAVNGTNKSNSNVISDLPAYAWDKSARYVLRSRITQAKLHPGQRYSPLLGWRSPYDQGSEVSFRQLFNLDEMPWVREHVVGGHVVFPMTAFLALGMEALRSVTSPRPSSILVQEFHAKRSLEIEEDERIDITTKLRPAAMGTENVSTSTWIFEILTWSPEFGWTSHCHGRIEAVAHELTLENPTIKASIPLIESDQLKERDVAKEYASIPVKGTQYGPSFKRMVKLWEGPGWTVAETELQAGLIWQPSQYGSPATVDAPTLDSFLQGLGPLLEPYGEKPALMPNYVSRLRISNNIPFTDSLRLTVVTRLLDYSITGGSLKTAVVVLMRRDGSFVPVAEWESVAFRIIWSGQRDESASNLPSSFYWDLIPSPDHIENEKLLRLIDAKLSDEPEQRRTRLLNLIGVYYMDRALRETSNHDFSQLPEHLARFKNWATRVVEREQNILNDVDVSALESEVSSFGGQGEMMCAVGQHLPQILRGEVQPLEVMLENNRLSRAYEDDMTNARMSGILARWVRNLGDVKSNLRVLEVGAGTGSATLPVFEELSRGGERLPDGFSFTYTDISSGFFEKAREKLGKWSKYITYKKLDISKDPVQQGFAVEDYDLVIASNVLHATPNMANTIDHVRSLLKPNGKLILLEACQHAPLILPFALLPGWWLAEDGYRSPEDGPLLSKQSWNRLLTEHGFSGLDCTIPAYPDERLNIMNVLTTRRVGTVEDDNSSPITVCGPLTSPEEEEFAQSVADILVENLNCETVVKPFGEVSIEDDPFCIFIDSPSNSIFKTMTEDTFELLKDFFLRISGLLWVIPENGSPDCDAVKGLLRTVRLENGSRSLLMLDKLSFTSDGASAILKLSKQLRDPEMPHVTDKDYVWRDGMLWLPRYRPLVAAKEVFASEAGISTKKEQDLWQDDVSFEMTVDTAGSPDSIYFKRTDVLHQPLGDDDILIRVHASGLNFRDVLLVLGSIPWTRPGFEGSGTVVKTGSRVTDLQPGDRVFFGCLDGGSFSTYVQVPVWMACKAPADFTDAEAAGISVAYSTAIMSLMRFGQLRKGESVLIHAASGAVGQACIVLAQHIGAEIFVTAGSPAKRDFLHEEYGIPRDHIFSSRTTEFRDGILAVTNGKGVDVIVNSLSGDLLQATWAVIADFGRFVEIGKRDLLQNNYLTMRPFDRNVTFCGVDLRTRFQKKPEEHRECLANMIDLVNKGVIKPIRPVTAVPVSQIALGMRKLQSGQNIGKIVITMGENERILAENPPVLAVTNGNLLRPDKTYIITGGTGGIGLFLAPWMVDNGARNVVLLGRSGDTRPEVQKVLETYKNTSVSIRAIACDVGKREDVVNALQAIQDLPPVGGVIHSALWLRDRLLENTTFEDWHNITTPRIKGAWNLHELLPDNLDFFVLLSTFLAGSGNIGQSIYSATASFYDSFAEYRNARGQPSVSVALPVVLGVGYVAFRNLESTLKGSLGAFLSEEHLLTVVKGSIIGSSSGLNRGGKAISFSFANRDDSGILPWQWFHPWGLVEYIRDAPDAEETGNEQGKDQRSSSQGAGHSNDPLLSLLDALMDKVSSITMIERDEIEPDAPLSNYSLDSLVSVELRNWIRRETSVEVPLPKIVNSGNLRALATHILSQKKGGQKK